MDKRTILAVALSVLVIGGSAILQTYLFPPRPVTVTTEAQSTTTVAVSPATSALPAQPGTPVVIAPDDAVKPKTVVVENNVIKVTFSNEGAVATSITMKKHKELDGSPVEMLLKEEGKGAAFQTTFGGFEADAVKVPFNVSQVGPLSWSFTRAFLDKNNVAFELTKVFTLKPDEYLIKVEVKIKGSNGALPKVADGGWAYTLSYGPQLGPKFKKLDNTSEFRKYVHFKDNNRSDEGLNLETKAYTAKYQWSGLVGKYFTVIGIPDGTDYTTVFSNKSGAGEKDISRLAFTRPALTSSDTSDTLYFYVGPKEESALKKYSDKTTNEFGLADVKLERSLESMWILDYLAELLKWIMLAFHSMIPNWGVSIIILTILLKLATWPLTAKSYRANAAMQQLQPKLKEMQEKYKDDPKKLNEATMGLYQKEGVNPLGGCLPMVLQIPIFFALYGLFNNHFDLRGAMFIPGWIPDLSLPDSVWHWGFALPFVNWTDLRILPLLMVGTQIWTSALSQPTGGMTQQMKIMTFGLPVIFLFMLYEMPSGLMVYWCVQNILTVVQQWYINNHFKKEPPKKAAVTAGKPNLKLAPKAGKKLSK